MTIAARSPSQAGRFHLAMELRGILGSFRAAFTGIALVSGLINVLMLTGPFYMLEIYDRVLTGRSIPTLVGISFKID